MASLTCLRYAEFTAIIPLMSCESTLFSTVSGNIVLNKLEPYILPLCLLLLSACCKHQCVAKHSASSD